MLRLILFIHAVLASVSWGAWTNNSVKRLIFLSSAVVREETSLTVTLNEAPPPEEEARYLVNIPLAKSEGLAYWRAFYVDSRDQRQVLEMSEVTIESDERTYLTLCKPVMARCFWVEGFRMAGLPRLQAGSTLPLVLSLSYGGLLVPVPKANAMGATLSVEYEDSAYFWSPYPTERQKTTIALPSDFKVLAKACPGPHSLAPKTSSTLPAGMVQYSCGVYANVAAHAASTDRLAFTVQFTQIPFMRARSLERSVTLLPWLNQLLVEESWDLVHAGFRLNRQGAFSRAEYMQLVQSRSPSSQVVGNVVLVVDEAAYDVDVRDDVGRLTGPVRKLPPSGPKAGHYRGQHFLHVTPRYPLVGGWAASYRLSYRVPLGRHLRVPAPGKRALSLPLFSVFFDIPIERFSLSVNLPEDAGGVEYIYDELGMAELHERVGRYKTYLSTKGEVALQLTSRMLTKEHSQPLTVVYDYPWWGLLRKPSALLGYILCVLLVVGGLRCLSVLSLDPKPSRVDTRQAKEALVRLFRARRACLNNLDDTLTTGDAAARSALEAELAAVTAQIFGVLRQVLAEDMAVSLYGATLKKLYEEHLSCVRTVLGLPPASLRARTPSVESLERDAQELDKRILALESQLFA